MKITYLFWALFYYSNCNDQMSTMYNGESHLTGNVEPKDPFEYEFAELIVYENIVYTDLIFDEFVYDDKAYRVLVKCEFDLKKDLISSIKIKRCGKDVYLGANIEEMDCTISIIRPWLQENMFNIEQNIRNVLERSKQ